MNQETISIQARDDPAAEDRARADLYALLASLFYGPPEAKLLAAIANAPSPEEEAASALGFAWRELQKAAAQADPEAVRCEYDALFVTVGQAPVMLYGSYYQAGFLHEQPLARLREALARLGFSRKPGTAEPEDHLSALCDVMRMLILEGGPGAVAAQQEFFGRFLQPWYSHLTAEIAKAEGAGFYRVVGRFAQTVLDRETQSLEIGLE